jgi:hypothetical protein
LTSSIEVLPLGVAGAAEQSGVMPKRASKSKRPVHQLVLVNFMDHLLGKIG